MEDGLLSVQLVQGTVPLLYHFAHIIVSFNRTRIVVLHLFTPKKLITRSLNYLEVSQYLG